MAEEQSRFSRGLRAFMRFFGLVFAALVIAIISGHIWPTDITEMPLGSVTISMIFSAVISLAGWYWALSLFVKALY